MAHALNHEKICIIGLGYVGFPLAIALSKKLDVKGVDINAQRVAQLKDGVDITHEVASNDIKVSRLFMTTDINDCKDCNVYIVTVPTPVSADNIPDLTLVEKATHTVAGVLKKGDIVVYESTVYPGVTEDICGKILEKETGLVCGRDFYLGYSPERINPGDKVHTVDKMTKVVAGQTVEVAERLRVIYGHMNEGNIFVAKDIKTAEASKVIENAQRDINIAFVNEIAIIFEKMGISVYDVLEAARTKWNFLPFEPGFVGGHCIGVDPYYLSYAAQKCGVEPHVILSGRQVNDGMAYTVADLLHQYVGTYLTHVGKKRVLILGMTFKENVPDIRNSKIIDFYNRLVSYGYEVEVFDPIADSHETKEEYGISLLDSPADSHYDIIVGGVPHEAFMQDNILKYLKQGGMFADIKGKWRQFAMHSDIVYWSL